MNSRKPRRATVLIEYDDDTTATFEIVHSGMSLVESIAIRRGVFSKPTIEVQISGPIGFVTGWPDPATDSAPVYPGGGAE